jgi:hypothetical protein
MSSSDDEHEYKDCLHCKGHRKTDYNSQREKQGESSTIESEYKDNVDQEKNDSYN